MTKRLNSKFKVYKQFGVQLWDKFKVISPKKRTRGAKPNLVENANRYAGIHGYAVKWTEKQIFRKFYGNISEKQLKKYVRLSKLTKDPMTTFIQLVESRLDVIIFRMFFADTVFSARQLINHGHIAVNTRVITKPSFEVRPGDIISTVLGAAEGAVQTAGDASSEAAYKVPGSEPTLMAEGRDAGHSQAVTRILKGKGSRLTNAQDDLKEITGRILENGHVSRAAARSALLIFENIVRRLVMIFRLDVKQNQNQNQNQNQSAFKGWNHVLNERAVGRFSGVTGSAIVQVTRGPAKAGSAASRQSKDQSGIRLNSASALKRNSKLIQSLRLLKLDTLKAIARVSTRKVNSQLPGDACSEAASAASVTIAPKQRPQKRPSVQPQPGTANRQVSNQSSFDSILKSLESAHLYPQASKTSDFSSQTFRDPRPASTSSASVNYEGQRPRSGKFNKQKKISVINFSPYIKTNFSLLTGVYLRNPEIHEIVYPAKLKFNFNRILNFYK